MAALLDLLSDVDQWMLHATHELRWEPLTIVFVLASAALVKGPLMVGVGACADLRCRRVPFAAIWATVSVLAAALLTAVLKEAFDRLRPPLADASVEVLVATPGTPSFPSGHAATAFAAATAVGLLHPRLRWPLFALAALVGFSRVYLGVHYGLDVLAGAALGVAVGYGAIRVARRFRVCP